MTILPTSKGAREIEILRHKMEEKIEEIEAGYDCLIEMNQMTKGNIWKRRQESQTRPYKHTPESYRH